MSVTAISKKLDSEIYIHLFFLTDNKLYRNIFKYNNIACVSSVSQTDIKLTSISLSNCKQTRLKDEPLYCWWARSIKWNKLTFSEDPER